MTCLARRTLYPVLLIALTITPARPTQAQTPDQQRAIAAVMGKGTIVTLRPSAPLFTEEGKGFNPPLVATITSGANGAVLVNGNANWISAGFPLLLPVKVQKVDRKPEYLEVELKQVKGLHTFKLRFPPSVADIAGAFNAVASQGAPDAPPSVDFRQQAYKALAHQMFVGELEHIPVDNQIKLVEFADLTAHGTTIASEHYKDHLYMVVKMDGDGNTYNDLRFNQSTLVAHVVNEELLTILKAFASQVKSVPAIQGLKIDTQISHHSFAEGEFAPSKHSHLELYAPADAIQKFANADITSQQLIDACVVVLDDNRIEVPLSGSGG